MRSFGNIVVFHPAAIGDAMLATPTASALKLNFPAAKLTYWTHPELRPILLGLCPAIDDVVDYDRDANVFELGKTFESLKPDLFVDLAISLHDNALTPASPLTLRSGAMGGEARSQVAPGRDGDFNSVSQACVAP